jgi:serine/threonine-protein kinase
MLPELGSEAAVAVSASEGHTCALSEAGSVYCWGSNDRGELGDGTTTDRLQPTLIGTCP